MFYGANGHYDYSAPISQQIANLQTLGMTAYRVAYVGPVSLPYLTSLATALKGTGITPIVCIASSMTDAGGNLYPNEAAAYAAGYAYALPCVQALIPLGVVYFECGNELDTAAGILMPPGSQQGGKASDFCNSNFPSLRGTLRGVYNAIRHVGGATAKIGSNAFTRSCFGCADMLWDGRQPDGTSGHNKVRWDWTNWHNYEDYGNPFDGTMSLDYLNPAINLCDHLQAKYGVPIIFTEWNGKASDTDAQRAAWAQTFMAEAVGWGTNNGLIGICCYQLYNGTPFGLMDQDGSIVQTFGQTVQSFIAAHPMP